MRSRQALRRQSTGPPGDGYKWLALSNTTLGVMVVTIDATIMIIAMPDIFRGIRLDPLLPSNSFYLLWMILSYLIVSSVLVVSFGRLGDIFGRVRIYNLGFVVYTLGSILLSITWMTGQPGALWLVLMRVVQGVGGAFLIANSAAILTDAFPSHQRGLALGINNVAGISGSFIGLVLGGDPRLYRLAPGLPGLGARGHCRNRLGLPQASRSGHPSPHQDRLVGQPHLRGGTGLSDDR
jgi:MFS family permease